MSRLRLRKFWKVFWFPFNVLGTIVVWLLFDVTPREAWKGEFDDSQTSNKKME